MILAERTVHLMELMPMVELLLLEVLKWVFPNLRQARQEVLPIEVVSSSLLMER